MGTRTKAIPGFSLTMGFSVLYLSIIVLLPLLALCIKTSTFSVQQLWTAATTPRIVQSYKLSFGMASLAAVINSIFGLLLAWVTVRYRFPGRKFVDALIDLPFALPTAVAGLALTALYTEHGLIGKYLTMAGIKVAFTPLGILVALIFIGIPFQVRTIQPVLYNFDRNLEDVAATLGAGRFKIFLHVIFPSLIPALLTGLALAFARGVGEYGSVIFIAGNIPMISEIAPLMIITKLEQYDYMGATAIASVLLICSFAILLIVNSLQYLSRRQSAKEKSA
ncbi:MAG: sulfate ABC transporter permease subunit CysT [Oligoflexales bacterium]|nr:sulfate ABC transporter permease subunit CysT [Oligoflexales bacterium]